MCNSPTRILHVVGTLNRGGIETWLHDAIARLPRERYQCDFCTYRNERGAYAIDLENSGSDLHFIPLGSSPLAIFQFSKRFRRLLREGTYDILHCHGFSLVGFILFLAWMEKTPIRIAHAHGTDRKAGGPVSLVDGGVLVLDRFLTRAFATHGVGCSAEAAAALFGGRWRDDVKIRVIHCGINLKPFEEPISNSVRDELGIPRGAKVIGHVGSFSQVKNQCFLVEVAAHLFSRRPDAMLLLVGEGILRRSVEDRCSELGICSRVIFAGESSRVAELMRSAMDLFVMPSLHEGLPLVLLEAQAAGLPCLVSDVVSREAMISDGTIQFLPLASGVEAWGNAISSLLETSTRRPDLLARMVNSDFNVAVSAHRLEDLYDMARQCTERASSAPSTDDMTPGAVQ